MGIKTADHLSVGMELDIALPFHQIPVTPVPRWDKEKLAGLVLRGHGRALFLDDVQRELEGLVLGSNFVSTTPHRIGILESFVGSCSSSRRVFSASNTQTSANASAFLVHASASRRNQDASQRLSGVKSARGYCLVVGIGAFDGLAQPSTDRKPAKSCGKGKKGQRKRKSSSDKGGKFPNLGTLEVLPKPSTSPSESPVSKKRPTEAGTTRGGLHHAPRLRPDQCMLCRQVGHRATEFSNRGNDCLFTWQTRI